MIKANLNPITKSMQCKLADRERVNLSFKTYTRN